MAAARNVFSIGRRRGHEDQLTEMLVWLVEAVPEVGEELIRLCFGASTDVETKDVRVTTQHKVVRGRLDAFLATPAFELIVESKLSAEYGDDQIRKYLDWLIDRPAGPRRGLMTLTARRADWKAEDDVHATANGITAAPRRWEQLHDVLDPFLQPSGDASLSARLVREFLEMLAKEGLIPVAALASSELGDLWARSAEVERRFATYFQACVPAIAAALGTEPTPNQRANSTVGLTLHDFQMPGDELILVAFQSSDEGLDIRPKVYRHVPIIWLAVLAKGWPEWEAKRDTLEESPPPGWRLNPRRWYGRPRFWRYLDELVRPESSFEEQSAAIASACGDTLHWLAAARPAPRATT